MITEERFVEIWEKVFEGYGDAPWPEYFVHKEDFESRVKAFAWGIEG